MAGGVSRVDPCSSVYCTEYIVCSLVVGSMDSIKLPVSGCYGAQRGNSQIILLIQMLAMPTRLQETSGTNRLNPFLCFNLHTYFITAISIIPLPALPTEEQEKKGGT